MSASDVYSLRVTLGPKAELAEVSRVVELALTKINLATNRTARLLDQCSRAERSALAKGFRGELV